MSLLPNAQLHEFVWRGQMGFSNQIQNQGRVSFLEHGDTATRNQILGVLPEMSGDRATPPNNTDDYYF